MSTLALFPLAANELSSTALAFFLCWNFMRASTAFSNVRLFNAKKVSLCRKIS